MSNHSTLPSELINNIYDYCDIDAIFREYFSNNVVIYLDKDWRRRFSRDVIPDLNKGWKLVCKYNGPCFNCYENGIYNRDPHCSSCMGINPCLNCYYYNEFESISCDCNSDELILVCYDQIKNAYPHETGELYDTYGDYLRSKNYLVMYAKEKDEWSYFALI